jgi:hypothetical protein
MQQPEVLFMLCSVLARQYHTATATDNVMRAAAIRKTPLKHGTARAQDDGVVATKHSHLQL